MANTNGIRRVARGAIAAATIASFVLLVHTTVHVDLSEIAAGLVGFALRETAGWVSRIIRSYYPAKEDLED